MSRSVPTAWRWQGGSSGTRSARAGDRPGRLACNPKSLKPGVLPQPERLRVRRCATRRTKCRHGAMTSTGAVDSGDAGGGDDGRRARRRRRGGPIRAARQQPLRRWRRERLRAGRRHVRRVPGGHRLHAKPRNQSATYRRRCASAARPTLNASRRCPTPASACSTRTAAARPTPKRSTSRVRAAAFRQPCLRGARWRRRSAGCRTLCPRLALGGSCSFADQRTLEILRFRTCGHSDLDRRSRNRITAGCGITGTQGHAAAMSMSEGSRFWAIPAPTWASLPTEVGRSDSME